MHRLASNVPSIWSGAKTRGRGCFALTGGDKTMKAAQVSHFVLFAAIAVVGCDQCIEAVITVDSVLAWVAGGAAS